MTPSASSTTRTPSRSPTQQRTSAYGWKQTPRCCSSHPYGTRRLLPAGATPGPSCEAETSSAGGGAHRAVNQWRHAPRRRLHRRPSTAIASRSSSRDDPRITAVPCSRAQAPDPQRSTALSATNFACRALLRRARLLRDHSRGRGNARERHRPSSALRRARTTNRTSHSNRTTALGRLGRHRHVRCDGRIHLLAQSCARASYVRLHAS